MSNRIVAAAVAAGLVFGGCGGGSSSTRAATAASPPATVSARCGAAPAYGRALSAAAASVVRLPGAPDGVATAADDRFAFIALQSGPPRVAVIEHVGARAHLTRTIPIPAYASGLRVTPDGRYVLAAAGRGVVVLDAAAVTTGASGEVLRSLAAPTQVAGSGPGAAEVAVSSDSRYAFVTLEGAGVVAVFDLRRGFHPDSYLGAVPVGAGALGIALSPDGRSLYEVSESGRAPTSRHRGVLNVIDVARAVRSPHSAVVARVAAPCAPVRVAASPDGATVWVTARDGNRLLGFSAGALRTDPARALVSATTVGSAPLGLAIAAGGRIVLVADSNLAHSVGGRSAVSIIDASTAGHPVLTGSLPAGTVADAIAVPAAGAVAFVTSSGSHTVMALAIRHLQ